MRLSVDKDDPGAAAFTEMRARGEKPIVRLDGEEVDDCVTADDEAGLVVRFKRNNAGEFVLTPRQDAVERETLTGTVSIEIVKDVQ